MKEKTEYRKCPTCGRITSQFDEFYCPKCNVRYVVVSEEDDERVKTLNEIQDFKDKNPHIFKTDKDTTVSSCTENIPKCPTCQSKNIKKISRLSKAGSIALWGIFAIGRTSKQWHCNNCGSEW